MKPSSINQSFYILLYDYDALRAKLYSAIESYIALVKLSHADTVLIPTETSVTQQIKNWPEGQFIYPPVSWVEPRKGYIDVDNDQWSYAFHGGGLSFAHLETTLDISVEFARTGDAAITEWTFRCYLETIYPSSSVAPLIIPHLDQLFDQAIKEHIIQPVPPIFEGDDQTYVFISPQRQTPD